MNYQLKSLTLSYFVRLYKTFKRPLYLKANDYF